MTELRTDVLHRLRTEWNAWLCTLRADGSPHVTPVWFVYVPGTGTDEGAGRFWISSSERNIKVRNVESDPRVSLALEDGTSPVVAEGRAAIHRHDLPPAVIAGFAEKYDGWDITTEFERGGRRVLLEVVTGRWLLAGTAQ
jgi:F420H(2)-dependent biliverdin reductase